METKKCGCCREEKSVDEFYRWKGKNRRWCKSCDTKYTILRQLKFKTQCVNYKGGRCEKCGYDRYVGALDFHHKDPNEKEFCISRIKSRLFDEKVIQELDKCELLCSNCHRELHQVYEKNQLEDFFENNKRERKKTEYFCECSNKKTKRAIKCKKCQNIKSIERDLGEVIKKVKETNWTQAGKYFGATDNALRKFVRQRGIDPASVR
jgi:hypothetical protein